MQRRDLVTHTVGDVCAGRGPRVRPHDDPAIVSHGHDGGLKKWGAVGVQIEGTVGISVSRCLLYFTRDCFAVSYLEWK